MNDIKLKLLSDKVVIPSKGSIYSACYDLHACFHKFEVKTSKGVRALDGEDFLIIHSEEVVLIPTGIIFSIPYEEHIKIYSRSGNALKKSLVVFNSPGIIDADYMFETFVMIKNCSYTTKTMKTGDAIAQFEVCKTSNSSFRVISDSEFNDHKDNTNKVSTRVGGFGSTS